MPPPEAKPEVSPLASKVDRQMIMGDKSYDGEHYRITYEAYTDDKAVASFIIAELAEFARKYTTPDAKIHKVKDELNSTTAPN